MDDQLSILNTSDGSNSISSKHFDATYHSIHGAIEESMHVFISAGLNYKQLSGSKSLRIFEMGFGSGLNAYLTSIEAEKQEIEVTYQSIELHPVPKEIYEQLNFHESLADSSQEEFIKLHEAKWDETISINSYFSLKKLHRDLEEIELDGEYDLIFYDAFAPNCQAQLWEEKIHSKLYDSLRPKGALVTYCAQGKFKRMLKGLGYSLDKLPGPGRKHEMTRAVKA